MDFSDLSLDQLQRAFGMVESSGNYGTLGTEIQQGPYAGDRAYGKYQVMGLNIPDWTERHIGVRMTPEQFLNDPSAQDRVFMGEMGRYYNRSSGSVEDRVRNMGSLWFTGRPYSAETANLSDRQVDPVTGKETYRGITNQVYGDRVLNFLGLDTGEPSGEGIMSTIQSRAGMLRDAFSPTPEGEEPVSLADRIDMGLGALFGTTDEGPSREGPDPERVARLRAALESGEISQEMYEDYYARLALEGPESSGRAAGLSNLSSYLLNNYEPQRFVGTSLPTSPMRGNSGSGTSAIQRLGVKPLA